MAAYAKGAPVRIIGAQATGAADFWYVKTDSPSKSLKDADDKTTRLFHQRILDPTVVRAYVKSYGLTSQADRHRSPRPR